MCMTFFIRISLIALFYLGMPASAVQASSGIVKVTPLGSHEGEFCKIDCALLFEDPNGTRLLYDAGRTVAGGNDTRLGNVDVVLVSVEIALVHKAVIVTGSEMPKFFATKLQALDRDPKASLFVRFGGSRTFGGVKITNDLSVYLSGDTGITTEQERVVRDHYGVKLAVINIGDTFTTGPRSVTEKRSIEGVNPFDQHQTVLSQLW